ncbi:MAG: alpha/beta hydrolase [Rhodospirillales bacterium]|nr:alpha/beta hydrolase [Rhodospirillales bacterium]MBN8907653.1 alpha/beta hydrolase [Rhodospirillales bacterium]
MHKTIRTHALEIAYLESGPPDGVPVILLHGWPSDVHDWDAVAPALAEAGCRVLVPWLRGFGPTRFLDPATPRSGQQAALGADLHDFMSVLALPPAILVGYDWGGRAACVSTALWPERTRALVSITGYNIQNIPASHRPADPAQEHRYWYQWYFHTERGRAGLQQNRRELCRLLWQLWSPNWGFDDATFDATAASFDNPDFVDVTIQSYRHRYRQAPGDPALDALEARLAAQPAIAAPSIVLHGAADGVGPAAQSEHAARHFTGAYERHVVPVAGHFLPRETPRPVIEAVLRLRDRGA